MALGQSTPQGTAAPAPPSPAIPSPETLILLIRSTLATLNDANLTGNYTVLRDVGAPGFQAANTAARLSQIFQGQRDQRLDMAPVLLVAPELTAGPLIDDRGLLRMAGFFPTEPLRIVFDLAFQATDGRWRLFGLSVTQVAPPISVPVTASVPRGEPPPAKKDAAPKTTAPKN